MGRPINVASWLALALTANAWSSIRNNGQNFLGTGMQPELVAKTLSAVEDEWKVQATHVMKCEVSAGSAQSTQDCENEGVGAPHKFLQSCATVASAIVQGSSGDLQVTKEYMVDVCSQSSLTEWRRQTCIDLAKALTMKMSSSSYENRGNFQTKSVCNNFWSNFVAEQKILHKKEMDALAAEEAEKKRKADQAAAEEAKREKHLAEKLQRAQKAQRDIEAKREAELNASHQKMNMDKSKPDTVEQKAAALEAASAEEIASATKDENGDKVVIKNAYAVLAAAEAADAPTPVAVNRTSAFIPKAATNESMSGAKEAAAKIPVAMMVNMTNASVPKVQQASKPKVATPDTAPGTKAAPEAHK